MASTDKYTRRELDDAVFAALEEAGDSPGKILGEWGALRAKLQAAGLPDPGAMSEAELFAMLTQLEIAEQESAIDEGAPVLAFKMRSTMDFEPFEDYDIVEGPEPPYHDDRPVLAVEATTGAIAATIPRELVPYLDPQGLHLSVGAEVIQLTPEWLKETSVRSGSPFPGAQPLPGAERGATKAAGDATDAPAAESTAPIARGKGSASAVAALLARRTR